MKTKADLQMRLAEIKIRGYIKDWDEFVLLYMIMTGQIDMPDGALYDAGTKDAKELRVGRGLFNPLKQIQHNIPNKDRLKKFAQHFPMLFRTNESPDDAISRLEDWLYNKEPTPSTWMQLIDGGQVGAHTNL
jgi:hypothetical protein